MPGHILSDRSALIAGLEGLHLQPHGERFPGLQAQVDNPDFASAARLRFLLESLIDHSAVRIGIVDAEDRDRLVMLCEQVD